MKKDTPISAGSAAALTARITATLGPLDADEQACCEKLEDLGAKVAELQAQISDAEENLRIVKAAKVDAIRSLMNDDPLLSQAFGGSAAEAVEEAAALEEDEDVVEATAEDEDAAGDADADDGNPLLKLKD
ncbi:hypothetical protein [Phycisphaera mikurensis]|uniref:Uncharacterized protein n=1 Tax=Phycisphaera mikurensis (strain NBRC 102666 / KCTC 22515 / FYK2301M01) TaxID=1142394 RepID=I0ICL2_PHYMF|nr:hypothetical protein [Phycisphaera mikurensis]MBB6442124.1 hypothetical protein [Phycisphaera mikurensis]BAM03000.1 hypothetical protein PSMK_08410 [Phycisphaera mikurensis NBRC 102666]